LTELIVGGPSLKLGESSIERLAQALACGGGKSALKKLVLIVSCVDLPAMKALGECFRATMDSLEDLHFYAGQTTERLVGSRSRYKSIAAPCVLGPGISSWVDAWTFHPNNHNHSTTSLRSLNLSRMDFGDEAAFALSRLLLAAPNLKVLNLAQDDFYGCCSKVSYSHNILRDNDNGENVMTHPPLSFAGTKRLLESLILIEDMKGRSRSSSIPLPLSCSNLLELDLSGWALEDDEKENNGESYDDVDDDKAVDNFYDDYNYIDDGCGEDDFEFVDVEKNSNNSSNNINNNNNNRTHNNERACCVIASMLRVNTTLQKLVLVAEDGSVDTHTSGVSDAGGSARGFLSFRSTLAIARALRDHVSIASKSKNQNHGKVDDGTSGGHHPYRRPPGSDLRTLVLSTNYSRGITRSKRNDASSWAIKERKRAVAKVFYQALKDRSIHKLRLQELSCTMAFRGLEPLGGGKSLAELPLSPPPNDLRDQLGFFLQKNRAINQSLKNIDSVWLPNLSSLDARYGSDSIDGDDNEDEDNDCHFVEVTEEHADATIAAARHSNQGRKKSPPVLVLALPALLAKAGQEAASHDVVFSCTRILATSTNLWEVTTEHRCEPTFTYRTNRKFRGTCT
jgi:hypothetical protein